MPNQRAESKVLIGGYIEEGLHKEVTGLAHSRGMSKTDFLLTLLTEEVERARARGEVPDEAPDGIVAGDSRAATP